MAAAAGGETGRCCFTFWSRCFEPPLLPFFFFCFFCYAFCSFVGIFMGLGLFMDDTLVR